MITNILNANQIIAKFVGGKRTFHTWKEQKYWSEVDGKQVLSSGNNEAWFWEFPVVLFPYSGYSIKEANLRFHEDWNALMKVVTKIEHSGYRFYLESNEKNSRAYFTNMDIPGVTLVEVYSDISTIDAVFRLCVEFIIWYNSVYV